MSYYLGIDLGTTFTAAAVWRGGRVEVCSLGNRTTAIPSVVVLREDQEVLTGEAAERRAAVAPDRVAREFKRRVGDPTPIIVGGSPYSADALMARLLRSVVAQVTEVENGPPAGVAICHPANWGHYKKDLLRQAVSLADLDGAVTVTEPEAAAIHYASQERVEPGSVISVYDLGGGTFDAAVLRKTVTGFDILGEPQGIERLGGVDFDEAVFQHVLAAVGDAVRQLDPEDPTVLAAMARLRQECVNAKEALSADTDVSIPIMLPNLQTVVRLTRTEFEDMIRPALADSVGALHKTLRLAQVSAADVATVLLVGGSSRIPLVAQLVGAELGRPVAVDAHPKHGTALGAAITAAEHGAGSPVPAAASPPTTPAAVAGPAQEPLGSDPNLAAVPTPYGSGDHLAPPTPNGSGRSRVPLVAALAALAAIVLGAVLLTRGGGSGDAELDLAAAEETDSLVTTSGAPPVTAAEVQVDPLFEEGDESTETYVVDKSVWWGGFLIDVDSVELSADEAVVSISFENLRNKDDSLSGEARLSVGELSGASTSFSTAEVPIGGRNRDTFSISLRDYEVTSLDDLVLTFGGSRANQASVPLGAGEPESFEPVAFDVDETLSTTNLAVDLGEGLLRPSYADDDRGRYIVRIDLTRGEFIGDQEELGSWIEVATSDFSLRAPSGDRVFSESLDSAEGDFSSETIYFSSPDLRLEDTGWLAFMLDEPGEGQYTLEFNDQEGGSDEVSFTINW